MEAIYRKFMTTKNYKTYKEIPAAIREQENFAGSSVQGVKENDWYYVYSYCAGCLRMQLYMKYIRLAKPCIVIIKQCVKKPRMLRLLDKH